MDGELLFAIVFIVMLVMSAVSFVLIAADKHKARRGRRRIPERTLHACEALGGWPGSLFAQHFFRHKTRSFVYQAVFWLIVLAHLALAFAWWSVSRA